MMITRSHVPTAKLSRSQAFAPRATAASSRPAESYQEAEKAELEAYNDRLRPELGALETPPAGNKAPRMEKARGYLLDLIDELAGKDLTRRNLELRVELFSGDVPQAALDDDMSREAEWKENHPDKEWPVRGWYGTPDGSDKPIYRMVVNLGMLRALESREELAFVLAQQCEILLDHDKADPTNEELLSPANQSFTDPRHMQADADRAAIERMVKAGFNPRGALHALNKLYALNPIDYPDDDLKRGLVAAAHGHEHEGMRLGLVQAEVEKYVRRQDPTTARPMQPLPREIKLQDEPGYQKPVSDKARFLADYKSLAEKVSGPDTPAWMFGDGVPPLELGTITLARGTGQDKEEALALTADSLAKNSALTPQQRVDGFLRLILSLDGSPLREKGEFSVASRETIHKFLADNGPAWDASKFYASLQGKESSLHNSLVRTLIFNESFQGAVGDALPGLVEGVPAAWITDTQNKGQVLEELPGLIKRNHSDSHNSWPLGAAIDRATLNFVSRLDGPALAKETGAHGAPRAITLGNDLLRLDQPTPEFQMQLREAARGLVEAGREVREDHARLRLRPPLAEPAKLTGYLRELGDSETWAAFSPQFEADLPQLLKDVVTLSTGQPDIITAEGRPGAYPQGLERRLVGLLKGENQKATLDHLCRNLQHDRRVRGLSPRREWLGEAARVQASLPTEQLLKEFTQPNLSQHSNLIKKSLVEGYNLKPEDLPDASTASLQALQKRVEADEFQPKRENYPSDAAYEKALQRYSESQSKIGEVMEFVAPMESRLVLGRMALLGHDAKISAKVAARLDLDSFGKLLKGGENAVERAELLSKLAGQGATEHVGADAGAFLMDGFLHVQNQVDSLERWYDLANRTIDFSHGGMEARVGTKRALAKNLFSRLQGLQPKELREWLGKDKVMDILSPTQASDLLVQSLGEDCRPGVNPTALAKDVALLDEKYALTEEHPVTYVAMRDKIADQAKLQPDNVEEVFPNKEHGVTTTNPSYARQARALSGLLAVARERSPQEQIDTIEYLMGRRQTMPEYLEKASDAQSFAPLTESLQTTRQELLDADSQTRVMIANSFLAGPSGVLRSEEGREAVISHFLKNLDPKNRELADKIARAVLYSQGEADTLAVAFILGQKPEEPKEGQDTGQAGKLDEATILNRLFDAYGVPGIKMKQYLAFTSEFKDFKEAFESAQDAALPLNYYQVLKLIQKRFGNEWPKDLEIDRVLGSGSVNVAIRYTDESKGKREVVSLGREDIVESTAYDFKRFHKFIDELTKTPEDREKFGYVLGLLNLIQSSVALEFDKEQALSVQKMAYKTYRHQRNGWTIKSIDAHRVEHLGLFMEEAKGRTARKIYTEEPDVYNDAMEAMASAEFGILKGQDARNNWWPRDMFANPDFHDGQVLIDKENKTVTILDFGQAVPIDNEDREAGLDLLTIIGKGDSPKAAAKRLNKRYFHKKHVMTPEELAPILERKDRMDCFIHLLSAISQNGAEVPLSSVHWILGINRQMALGEKIEHPIDKQIRNMVITHKLHLPLAAYNTAHAGKETAVWLADVAVDTAVKVGTGLAHLIGGWFGWETGEEKTLIAHRAAPPKQKTEVQYHAWRPDFSGNAQ